MLRRQGNKKKLAPMIIEHFPEKINFFVDLFFGTGAISCELYRRGRVKHVLANDFNEEVFNLYMVLQERLEEFKEQFSRFPVHESLFKHWRKSPPQCPVLRAVCFVFISNFSLFGGMSNLCLGPGNSKKIAEREVDSFTELIKYFTFSRSDFREALEKIHFNNKGTSFIYADPPYQGNANNYGLSWRMRDTKALFRLLVDSGVRFAISEFEKPRILDLANQHGLRVIRIGERQTIKSRRVEILITNWEGKGAA